MLSWVLLPVLRSWFFVYFYIQLGQNSCILCFFIWVYGRNPYISTILWFSLNYFLLVILIFRSLAFIGQASHYVFDLIRQPPLSALGPPLCFLDQNDLLASRTTALCSYCIGLPCAMKLSFSLFYDFNWCIAASAHSLKTFLFSSHWEWLWLGCMCKI